MKGTIGLQDLRIDCVVGIYDFERTGEQPLFVDVEVERDFAEAAAREHVDHTVDYDGIATLLTELAQERKYQLIETFAEEGAAAIFGRWPGVERVRIEVRKPKAVPAAKAAFVRIERSRGA